MTWVKLDDGYYRHPKARAIGKDGRALHIASMCWCAANLTDGLIRRSDLPLLLAEAEVKRTVVDTLVEYRAWVQRPDGWELNDFLAYNRSAASVRAEREEAAERMRRNRERRSAERTANVRPNIDRSSPYPDPTRPDPTPLLDPVPPPQVCNGRPSGVVAVIDLLVDAALADEQPPPRRPDPWCKSVHARLTRELADTIAAQLADDPDPVAVAQRHADPVAVRIAARTRGLLA